MRRFITLALLLFSMNTIAQKLNQKIEDQTRHKTVLINTCTRDAVTNFPEMKERYDVEYPAYQPDSTTVQELKNLIKEKQVVIILGTWCGDSKMQVPRFLKVLDLLNFDKNSTTLICVDGAKKAAPGLIDQMKITHVPTFIIKEKEKELGRITESPSTTLEQDLLLILQKK